MRFELYHVEISRTDRTATGYIVASGEQRAAEIVIEREIMLNQENCGFTLERVDDTLPQSMRVGLDALLENAPAGVASFSSQLGWVAHATIAPRLLLFRIEEHEGKDYFIIALPPSTAKACGWMRDMHVCSEFTMERSA